MRALAIVLTVVFAIGIAITIVGIWWYQNTFGQAPCRRTFWIPSSSMLPTLKVGDSLCVDTLAYAGHKPADGDIVVLSAPPSLSPAPFIKRVVAVPGDSIAIRNGAVFRDGRRVDEPYVAAPADYDLKLKAYDLYVDDEPLDRSRANIPPKASWSRPDRVPDGYFLVLGDNRNNSFDSHMWGFVRRDQLLGMATSIYWPLADVRSLVARGASQKPQS